MAQERKKVSASKYINGTHATAWMDGECIFEMVSFKSNTKINREKIQQAGEMYEDSKVMGMSNEFTMKIRKLYSRSKKYAQEVAKGKDPRVTIIVQIADPDNGGIEEVQYTDCWFDELVIQDCETGKISEEEYKGGFTKFHYIDDIKDPCLS